MRNISLLIAFAFTVAAPSVAGSTPTRLPGVGTFSYAGSAVDAPAPAIVLAGLTRADRS